MRVPTLLFIVGLLLSCRRPSQNPLSFVREEVDVRVRPGKVEVCGTYHFACRTKNPVRAVMFYPFPLDSSLGYPDSVGVSGRDFVPGDSGVRFEVALKPNAEESVTVFYRQPVLGRSARYIVTTTQRWHEPIALARFSVTVPTSLAGAALNYRPDSVTKTESTLTWFFARKRFFPSDDVVVSW